MLFYTKFIIVFYNFLLVVSCMLIEDLEPLFNKPCIEASLVPVTASKTESGIMLDSASAADEAVLVDSLFRSKQTVLAKIHELAQHNNIDILFKLLSEEGPPHEKVFRVKLLLSDEYYEGIGPSLREAKQVAAAQALKYTFFEHPPTKIKEEKPQTPTVILNNLAVKLGLSVSYFVLNGHEHIDSYGVSDEAFGRGKSYYQKINSTSNRFKVPVEEPQISGPFTVRLKLGDLVFTGVGHTIQTAKHNAAAKALYHMEKETLFKDNVCLKEESVEACKKKKALLKSPISRIYEAGAKHDLPVDFTLLTSSGQSHKRVFITRCQLGSFITEGEGASKKESKKIAAEKMLHYLPQLPEIYDSNAVINGFKTKNKKKKKAKVLRDSNENLLLSMASSLLENVWTQDGSTTSQSKDSNNFKEVISPKDTTSQSKDSNNFKQVSSPKDKMLEIANKLNIAIEFIDLGKHDNYFYSLVSLGLHPPHVCMGKDIARELSHEKAASHAILFLHSSGIFEKNGFADYNKRDATGTGEYNLEKDLEHFFEDLEESE